MKSVWTVQTFYTFLQTLRRCYSRVKEHGIGKRKSSYSLEQLEKVFGQGGWDSQSCQPVLINSSGLYQEMESDGSTMEDYSHEDWCNQDLSAAFNEGDIETGDNIMLFFFVFFKFTWRSVQLGRLCGLNIWQNSAKSSIDSCHSSSTRPVHLFLCLFIILENENDLWLMLYFIHVTEFCRFHKNVWWFLVGLVITHHLWGAAIKMASSGIKMWSYKICARSEFHRF